MLQLVKNAPKDHAVRYLLGHGSYVDERHRIVYVETPKVACTSIKFLLRGLDEYKPLRFLSYSHASTAPQRIHDRNQMPLPPISAFSRARQQSILNDPGWFRFCVVRHPYDRVFSAWRDKIFFVEPGYEKYQSDKTKKYVEFTDFVTKVLAEDPYHCDVHWRLQVSLLLPDFINYTRIYEISDVSSIPADLQAHLATIGVTGKPLVLQRINESWPIAPDNFLAPDITASLRAFYSADFERFKFPERETKVAAPASAATLVNEFSDAVYDRNRVLMDHVLRANRRRKVLKALRVPVLLLIGAGLGLWALSSVLLGGRIL